MFSYACQPANRRNASGGIAHTNAALPAFDDAAWQTVTLPHAWNEDAAFKVSIAAHPTGIAWYRKTFQLPASMRGRRVSIRFDGVYRDSTVWINGAQVGTRPYGYSTFEYDLTRHLRFGARNVLAVRVDHSVIADSRWYPGSGIYRHVWLNVTGPYWFIMCLITMVPGLATV